MVTLRVTKASKQKDRTSFMRREKRAQPTPAQVATRAARRVALLGEMAELAAKHDEELITLAQAHNRSVKWVRKMFNRKTLLSSTSRKASAYNAFLWKRARSFREESSQAYGRDTLKEMNKALNDEYYALEPDALAKMVKEYEQHRVDKANVAHHVAPAQHSDFDKTFKNLMDVATGLANRCGLMFFMFFANKDGSAYGSGKQGYSSDAAPFFANSFGQTPEQVAEMFQGFAISRKANVPAKDLSNNVGELKKEARRVISKHFHQFERREKAKIPYNPLQMLSKYGLKFVGWNDGEFPNPGKLCTAAELHKLIDSLQEGTCGFERVDAEDMDRAREEIMARASREGYTLDKPRKERSDKNKRRKTSDRDIDMNGAGTAQGADDSTSEEE